MDKNLLWQDDMVTFAKVMALFWTLSEGLILIYVRGGLMSLRGTEKGVRHSFIFLAVALGLLSLLVFGGECFFGRFAGSEKSLRLNAFRWALWNFLCTLWVVLEGVIMVYVLRIYRTLKPHLEKREREQEANTGASKDSPYGILFLVISFFAFYAFYEYNLLSILHKTGLDRLGIYRMSVFYVRICGLFWILFEWIVAFVGVKIFHMLKREERSLP